MHPQLETVGAEGVRLDAVRTGRDVLGVHPLDELGIVDAQDIEARVQGHAAAIEHGAHGPVAKERAFGQSLDERRRHQRTAARSRRPRAVRTSAATWSGPSAVVSTAKSA